MKMTFVFLISLIPPLAPVLMPIPAVAEPPKTSLLCRDSRATQALIQGYEFQKDNNTPEALKKYSQCLIIEPNCVDCLYEIGWSYWKFGDWDHVVETWKKAQALKPDHALIRQFLPAAEGNQKALKGQGKDRIFRNGTDLLQNSVPSEGPLQITQVARWQSYNPKPNSVLDHFDVDIDSPKSVLFSQDGKKAFVHSLEGSRTLVLSADGSEKLAVIQHQFKAKSATTSSHQGKSPSVDQKAPFDYVFKNKKPWIFSGKPVESVLTHEGRYLWITYYRRDFDSNGIEPSAMAIVDTLTNQIVRVMGTGSISKYIASSPDGKWLAVSNWGDNTIGLYDISSNDPRLFHEQQLLIVGQRLALKGFKGDRDKDCGYCVRGLEFSRDGQYLLATRMKGGGIAVFDLKSLQNKPPQPAVYRGTIFGMQPGPRDIHLSPDGQDLFIGCNASGTIVKVKAQALIDLIKGRNNADLEITEKDLSFQKRFVGLGVRSFKVSPDGKYLFVAVNNSSEVVVLDAVDLKILSRLPVDSFPVGLSINPDGTQLWVTSQGKDHQGGNSVGVFQIFDRLNYQIHSKQTQPTPDRTEPKIENK